MIFGRKKCLCILLDCALKTHTKAHLIPKYTYKMVQNVFGRANEVRALSLVYPNVNGIDEASNEFELMAFQFA